MKIEIREANAADSAEIETVGKSAVATLRQTHRPNKKAIAHKAAISESLTKLVALIDGRVVGTVQYGLVTDRIHFLSLDVHADWRRNGVARRLIAELEGVAKLTGAARLSTYTVTQTGNCEIFERLGFRLVSENVTEFYESDTHNTLTECYFDRDIN